MPENHTNMDASNEPNINAIKINVMDIVSVANSQYLTAHLANSNYTTVLIM